VPWWPVSDIEVVTSREVPLGGQRAMTVPHLMWWNFVGRTHDEIVEFRKEWEAGSERFGRVEGYRGQVQRLPAPPMPPVRIKPRLSPPGPGNRSVWG
jgi:quercetin 2,3-dioxygenase